MPLLKLKILFIALLFSFILPKSFGNFGSDLFLKVKDSLFLVKIALDADSPKSSYGSGFAISKNGEIITNYHVISEKVQQEEGKYKIFVEDSQSNIYEAKLIKFDVIRDLAYIKIDKKFKKYLKISKKKLNKGEKIYSFGVPKDLNEVIVEGTYNGTVVAGIYQQLHLSSAINSGMSGGPIVNSRGEVIGVNVSVLLDSQNISFGVPKSFVKDLISSGRKKMKKDQKQERKNKKEKTVDEINKENFKEIEQQLMIVAKSLGDSLDKDLEIVKLGNFLAPQSKKVLKCWSYYRNSKELTYKVNRRSCQLNGAVYIKDGEYTGSYNVTFTVVENKKRNKLQYFHLMESYYNEIDNSYYQDDEFLSSPICRDLNIKNKSEIPFKINYCLMKYKKFTDLFILDLKAISLLRGNENIIMELHFYGAQSGQINSFIKKYLDLIGRRKDA